MLKACNVVNFKVDFAMFNQNSIMSRTELNMESYITKRKIYFVYLTLKLLTKRIKK